MENARPTMKTITIIAANREWTARLTPAGGRGFVVTLPELPGLTIEGRTLTEARAKAANLLRQYLASPADAPAAFAAIEGARQRSRIERELRDECDDEPSASPEAVERWAALWGVNPEL